jgi:hypothetical protein
MGIVANSQKNRPRQKSSATVVGSKTHKGGLGGRTSTAVPIEMTPVLYRLADASAAARRAASAAFGCRR